MIVDLLITLLMVFVINVHKIVYLVQIMILVLNVLMGLWSRMDSVRLNVIKEFNVGIVSMELVKVFVFNVPMDMRE